MTYPDPLGPMLQPRVGGKHAEIRTGTSTGFQFRRLPVRPVDRSGFTYSREMAGTTAKVTGTVAPSGNLCF